MLQFSIWNSAKDRSNFTVTIYTENLDCDHNRMKLYGQEMSPGSLVMDGLTDDDLVAATVNIMNLHNTSNTGGLNQCVYHQVCDGGCNFITMSIPKGEEQAVWKLCEVTII